MELKEKLVVLKNQILSRISPTEKDFEFDAPLEDHPIGNQSVYRLYYVDYHRFGYGMESKSSRISSTNWPFKPFMLPAGMTREEGFEVLSYLTDSIEKRGGIEPCSWRAVNTLDGVLDLERFGFTRVDEKDERNILNLFTVTGRVALFQQSELYSKYFEWYREGITSRRVKDIYAKQGLEFHDIAWLGKGNGEEKGKVFKK